MNNTPSEDYKIDIKALFARANDATKQNLPVLLRCIFIIIFFVITALVIFYNNYNIETVEQLDAMQTETYLFNMVVTVFLAPLWAAIAMMAVKTQRNQISTVGNLFDYLPFALALATAELCISLMTQVGMTLFIIPAIYLFIATSFTKYLIADKGMNAFSAIKCSIQMANKHLLQLSILFAIFFALALLGVITFGLAFIWIAPLYFNVTAILYTDLFNAGNANDKHEAVTNNTEETHFDA